MAKKVIKALTQNKKIMIEAGTGTGKTFAYLVPALLSGKKVVLSTGTKNLQDQIFLKDLAVLRGIFPNPINAVLMKGKENYLCKSRFAGFSFNPVLTKSEETPYIDQIMNWAKETSTGDKAELLGLPENIAVWKEISVSGNQCLGKSCSQYDSCFLFQIKKDMEEAQLIIVNHHLFFADLALKETSFGQILSEYEAVIFDEAHLIEEIASGYFGKHLSPYEIYELVADARRELKILQNKERDAWENLDHLLDHSEAFFKCFVQAPDERRFKLPLFSEYHSNFKRATPILNSLQWLSSAFQNLADKTEGSFKISERATQLKEDAEFFLKQESSSFIYWGESRSSEP
ncbi:MAG: ATP-dependent DNA helicase, partial [Nitrospiria bacterium]